jgi:hypothetical protein
MTGREPAPPRRRQRARRRRKRAGRSQSVLARYLDGDGRGREVIARPGAAASTLVIDRVSAEKHDARLVAHLAADEPEGNATLVCRSYLLDISAGGGRCRRFTAEDLRVVPFSDPPGDDPTRALVPANPERASDRWGRSYELALVHSRLTIPELRWFQRANGDDVSAVRRDPVSVREVIGWVESYEPVRALTSNALCLYHGDEEVSTTVLRAELARIVASPIVLNRALRQAVVRAVEREQLSMSEIAIRCGRVKRDRRGNQAGETSWLARRVGLMAEGGRDVPTPWIHSDVLALIARRGLGISPREVEA